MQRVRARAAARWTPRRRIQDRESAPPNAGLQRERESGRFYRWATIGLADLPGRRCWLFSVSLLRRRGEPGTLLSPPLIALLLIANLIPAIALMVLLSRKRGDAPGGEGRARQRAAAHPAGRVVLGHCRGADRAGRDFRLACCSRAASNSGFPTARAGMLENTVAGGAHRPISARSSGSRDETVTMSRRSVRLSRASRRSTTRASPRLRLSRCSYRNLTEAVIFNDRPGRRDPDAWRWSIPTTGRSRTVDHSRSRSPTLQARKTRSSIRVADRIGVADPARTSGRTPISTPRACSIPQFQRADRPRQRRAQAIIALLDRSRANQLRFNAALLLGALIIVGLAIFAALKLADRLVRPVGELVDAAGRIEEGDFSARVPVAKTEDEIADAGDRVQPDDRAARGADRRLLSRQHPARHPPRVHRGGAVERHRRRHRARCATATSCWSIARPRACSSRGRGDRRARRSQDCRAELDEFMRGEQREANVAGRRRRRPAHAGGQARALCRRRGADLRRHHRPVDRPAPRRLVRHRPAHRARDQEPADPDPARRRAAPAALRQGSRRRTPKRSSG